MIEISVGDVDLVGLVIDLGLAGLAWSGGVVGLGLVALLPDLQPDFALPRDLQLLAVLLAVAADPDEALVVDAHTVLVLRPIVAGSGTAPGLHQLAVLVELHDRRGLCTAPSRGRVERRRPLVAVPALSSL